MNIWESLQIYAKRSNRRRYDSLRLWSESVSRDLNGYSMTCYPNGFRGFSFGDRLNAIVYITLAYYHKKIFYEGLPDNEFLQIPGTDHNYWNNIISKSLVAQSSDKNLNYNEIISELFSAVYNYSDWQSFIISTIGYFDDDDDETVKAFSFMFSEYHNYSDDYNYQIRNLKEEVDFINHCIFYKFGLFDYVIPPSVEADNEDISFIDRLYRRIFLPVWDKNNKYKNGDIVTIDKSVQVNFCGNDFCLILN